MKKYKDYLTEDEDGDEMLTLTKEADLKLFTWRKWEGIARLLEDESLADEDVRERIPLLYKGSCGYCLLYYGSDANDDESCIGCPLKPASLCCAGMGEAFEPVDDFRRDVGGIDREHAALSARTLADAIWADIERSRK